MCILSENPATGQSNRIQKGIQAVLEEQKLWPRKRVRLFCEKPKCSNYQSFTTCTICIKGCKCESYKDTKEYSRRYIKQQLCNKCENQKSQCQCVTRKYCIRCKQIILQKNCIKCEQIPSKCITESKFFNLLFNY